MRSGTRFGKRLKVLTQVGTVSSRSNILVAQMTPQSDPVATAARKIKRGSGSHTALEILKVMRKPLSLDDLTYVSPRVLSSDKRGKCVKHLIANGFVTITDNGRYMITDLGIAVLYKVPLDTD